MMNTQLLQKGFLFEKLGSSELEAVAAITTEKDVIAGDFVFSEGSPSASLYVIKHGTIEIFKKGSEGSDDHLMSQLSAGSHFGDMGFIDKEPRNAGAMAKENTRLLEVPYEALERLVASKPDMGLKIYRALATTLCRRIRQTTNNLASLKELKLRHL